MLSLTKPAFPSSFFPLAVHFLWSLSAKGAAPERPRLPLGCIGRACSQRFHRRFAICDCMVDGLDMMGSARSNKGWLFGFMTDRHNLPPPRPCHLVTVAGARLWPGAMTPRESHVQRTLDAASCTQFETFFPSFSSSPPKVKRPTSRVYIGLQHMQGCCFSHSHKAFGGSCIWSVLFPLPPFLLSTLISTSVA